MIDGVSIDDVFGAALPCSWGGIGFYVLDTRLTAGRRLQKFLFPGRNRPAFDDLGALNGPIVVSGFLAGDDYVQQAEALRAAFLQAGAAPLTLPWFSSSPLVILKEPAEISYKIGELRLARFSAQFELFAKYRPTPADTLQQLGSVIGDLEDAARSWIAGVLAPLQLPLAIIGYAQRFAGYVSAAFGVVQGLAGGGGSSGQDSTIVANAVSQPIRNLNSTKAIVATAVAGPLATLAITELAGADALWAGEMAVALCAVPEAAAAASVPTPPAAVGPGGSTATPAAADPQATANMLLAAAAAIGGSAARDPDPGPSLSAALVAVCVVQAASASSDVAWSCQQDALDWQATLVGRIDAASDAIAAQVSASPLLAGAMWSALQDVRSAVMIDMQDTIGRLPAVEKLLLPITTSAWIVAQYLVGDNPADVLDSYADLIARNKVVHPALMPAGKTEFLQ